MLVYNIPQVHAQRARELVVSQFDNTTLISTAIGLYRLAIEREKPDAARIQGFQERDLPTIEARLKQMQRRYVPAMDRELQHYWLREYLALPKAQRLPTFDRWIGARDQASLERLLDRLAGSTLVLPEARMRWFNASRSEFESSHDQAIGYAVAMLPAIIERELRNKTNAGEKLHHLPHYLQALADAAEARTDWLRQQAALGLAHSRLRQALGQLP